MKKIEKKMKKEVYLVNFTNKNLLIKSKKKI